MDDQAAVVARTFIVKPASDNIYRIQSDATEQMFEINLVAPTETFVEKTNSIFMQSLLLQKVVKNLWKTYLYNREYISFLLGAYDKHEFCELAKGYAEPFESASREVLDYASNFLTTIVGPIDATDLSVMMNVDHSIISNECAITESEAHKALREVESD